VIRGILKVGHKTDPPKPIGIGLQTMLEVCVMFEARPSDLHETRTFDPARFHLPQQVLDRLLPLGRQGIVDLPGKLSALFCKHVYVCVNFRHRLLTKWVDSDFLSVFGRLAGARAGEARVQGEARKKPEFRKKLC
jgi:hypothetical protein